MQFRCPMHDTLIETETDHSKPGTRETDSEGKQTGPIKLTHPLFWNKEKTGYIAGHPDCVLCRRAVREGDPNLIDRKPVARQAVASPAAGRRVVA